MEGRPNDLARIGDLLHDCATAVRSLIKTAAGTGDSKRVMMLALADDVDGLALEAKRIASPEA